MAKMFYTMDETKAALAKNEEEIKQLAREGRLREFRDGPRLMFKADQVEAIKAELAGGGGGDAISLAPEADSGAPIGLAGDSSSGSRLGLESRKEETAFDLGLGGSRAGVPSPGKVTPGSGSGLTGLSGSGISSGGARGGGITIFDVDDDSKADPSAATAVNPSIKDQINLESVGSGSGLLDLTRESDDTSLGAVFDELQPGPGAGASGAPAAGNLAETQAADFSAPPVDRGPRSSMAPTIYVDAPDPLAVGLGAAALVAAIVLCFGGFILMATLAGYRPDILNTLRWEAPGSGKMYLLAAAGVTLIAGVIGFVVGKATSK